MNISYQFLKYVRPIWYFHLKPINGENMVWVEYSQLSKGEKEVIHYDTEYSSPILSNWDASYQALMKGIIREVGNNHQVEHIELIPNDIYRFIRKYHKNIWVYITLVFRLISLYNPIRECIGIWQTRKVMKMDLFHNYYIAA